MKTICLLESLSRNGGGIFESECALQRSLARCQGVEVDVIGLGDRHTTEDLPRWLPLKPKVLKVLGPIELGYSKDLLAALDHKADLLYAATLWRYPSWAALRWAEKTDKPMMVAPHGSLDPWALRNSIWKKKMTVALFKNRQLHKASCIRALSQSEAEAIRAYGLRRPIAVIPNGVEIPEKAKCRHPSAQGDSNRKKMLLFLGRIHPKKGLLNALRAFAENHKTICGKPMKESPWQFVIAGWDQGGHQPKLMQLCKELGLSYSYKMPDSDPSTQNPQIIFSGPVFGAEKEEILNSADAFILPSLSEGLPMSVLEAWAHGLPVVMTPECNLSEGFIAEAAIRVETGWESIARGLETIFSMSDADLDRMGAKGRELVRHKFSWKTIAAQMKESYDWMLGAGTKPSCVIVN